MKAGMSMTMTVRMAVGGKSLAASAAAQRLLRAAGVPGAASSRLEVWGGCARRAVLVGIPTCTNNVTRSTPPFTSTFVQGTNPQKGGQRTGVVTPDKLDINTPRASRSPALYNFFPTPNTYGRQSRRHQGCTCAP